MNFLSTSMSSTQDLLLVLEWSPFSRSRKVRLPYRVWFRPSIPSYTVHISSPPLRQFSSFNSVVPCVSPF